MKKFKRLRGFFQASIAVLRSPRLTPEDKELYFELLTWAWDEKTSCFPRQCYLAKHLNCSIASIKRRLQNLVRLDLVVVHDRRPSGRPNKYELVLEPPTGFCDPRLLTNAKSVLDTLPMPTRESKKRAQLTNEPTGSSSMSHASARL